MLYRPKRPELYGLPPNPPTQAEIIRKAVRDTLMAILLIVTSLGIGMILAPKAKSPKFESGESRLWRETQKNAEKVLSMPIDENGYLLPPKDP